MAEQPLTPEEKLLRIIESQPQVQAGMRPLASQRRGQDFKFSWKLLKAKYGQRVAEKSKDFFNLRTLNYALVAFSAVATVFVGLDFSLGLPRADSVEKVETAGKQVDIGDLNIERLAPLSDYLLEITQRNIFALPESPPQQPAAAASTQPIPPPPSPTEGLKIVGIIWSDTPQVVIEDSKDSRTYLLYRGSKIKNGRVKEILKDRVILSYDNQDIELR